jgi:hypothetical protein
MKAQLTLVFLIPVAILLNYALAQEWAEKGEAITGQTNQHFGSSLDVNHDGNTFIAGTYAGSSDYVAVYYWNGTNWVQQGNSFTQGNVLDLFSTNVGIDSSGNSVVISYPFNDEAGSNRGAVKIFDWNDSTWVQRGQTIYGDSLYDAIGRDAVCISNDGNTIAYTTSSQIGNPDSGDFYGYAKIFHWSGSEWLQMGTTITGNHPNVYFGANACISGDGKVFAISAPNDNPNGEYSGMSRIFFWNGTDWEQKGDDINGLGMYDNASTVVLDRSGNRLLQGAYNGAGYFRVFNWNGATWQQMGNTVYGSGNADLLGFSVSMDETGSKIAVAAPQSNAFVNNGGLVYTLSWNGSQWEVIGEVLNGTTENGVFGRAIRLSGDGNTLGVGGPQNNTNGSSSGDVQMYYSYTLSLTDLATENWYPSPNPNSGSIVLPEAVIAKASQLVIMDEKGSVVANYFPATDKIKEIHLPYAQGTYTIVLYSEGTELITRKIVRL